MKRENNVQRLWSSELENNDEQRQFVAQARISYTAKQKEILYRINRNLKR
jgi:hypothetical protein